MLVNLGIKTGLFGKYNKLHVIIKNSRVLKGYGRNVLQNMVSRSNNEI